MFDEENHRYLDCINNVAHGEVYLIVYDLLPVSHDKLGCVSV